MNRIKLLVVVAFLSPTGTAIGQVFSTNFSETTLISDAGGHSFTRTLSGVAGPIADLNVQLNIDGEFNGDLYVSLTHDTGFSVLLNRVGKSSTNPNGYSDAGVDITLDHTAVNGDIHFYRNVVDPMGGLLTGAWAPDARDLDPALASGADYENSSFRTKVLTSFNDLDPNGSWTLIVQDLDLGLNPHTLDTWGLEVTPVPEPAEGGIVVGILALLGAIALKRKKNERLSS